MERVIEDRMVGDRTRGARRGAGLLLALLLAGAAPAAAEPRTLVPSASRSTIDLRTPRSEEDVLFALDLERGKSAFLRTEYAVRRVSVGDPEILDVVVIGPRELQVVARALGSTNVLLWGSDGAPQAAIAVQVGGPHLSLQRELRRLLGNDDIRVGSAGHALTLSGSVSSAVALEQALAVARAFMPAGEEDRIINLLEVGGHHQVMLQVVVAEMSRSVRREFGTNFNALIDPGKTGGKSLQIFGLLEGLTSAPAADPGMLQLGEMVNLAGTFTGMGSLESLRVFLDLLDSHGLSKVLAEPTLVARSGESADFLVGGEVPIPVAQGGALGSITIEFKKFGVGLVFTPTVLGPDRIHIQLNSEVSEPDFAFGTEVEGTIVPAFRTRRAATAVELGDGESFAVAGLLGESVSGLSGMYPLLGQVPILGALFRSSQFERSETELVVIVTPRLVKPMGPGPHPRPTDFFVEPSAWEFYLLGRLEGAGVIGEVGHRVSTSLD